MSQQQGKYMKFLTPVETNSAGSADIRYLQDSANLKISYGNTRIHAWNLQSLQGIKKPFRYYFAAVQLFDYQQTRKKSPTLRLSLAKQLTTEIHNPYPVIQFGPPTPPGFYR